MAFACSAGTVAPPHPPPRAPRRDPAPTATTASERECDELITHAVKLGIDERASEPGGEKPQTTAADHEAVRRKLHEDFMADCRTLPHEAVRCAMAQTTLAELSRCQSTRSNSTSNSSVAPGGMTPPAPRSP
jgi:hypothetical protein